MTSAAAADRATGRFVAVTVERVGARMAGPAIRAVELTRCVADAGIPATVVSLTGVDEGWRVPPTAVHATGPALRQLIDGARAVLVQGDVLGLQPWIADLDVPIVVDAYDPFHFEQLEQARGLGESARRVVVRDCVTSLNRQLSRADLVLAASEQQRNLWLGHLAALGRINPLTYDDSADLSRLLAVVPFGLPAEPPARSGTDRIRAMFPAIGATDRVVLWAGGMYDWFDPAAVVRATALLPTADRSGDPAPDPTVHLVLMGGAHPVLGTATRAESEARAAAAELGLDGVTVHFVDEWVPYDQRADWLVAADAAVVAIKDGIESRFAFRTRLLDHLWAGLPTVVTAGDPLGEELASAGAAVLAAPGDPASIAAAIRTATAHDAGAAMRSAAGQVAQRYRWRVVARPLVAFARAPRRAPDLVLDAVDRVAVGVRAGRPDSSAADRLRAVLAADGVRGLAGRLRARLGRRR